MNLEYFLYQYLLKNGKAEVPDFGVFELTKESAKIDAKNSIIIPPKEVITFDFRPAVFDNSLTKHIADETGSNLFIVQMNIKNEVAKWLQQLQKDNILNLENLGQYQFDDNKNVVKITDNNSGIFGLEEINIQNLKSFKSKKKTVSEDYKFDKKVIWTFLSLIITGCAALFLFGDKELLFGKSSQIPTKEVRKISVKKTAIVPKQDTVKKDSINKISNAKSQETKR